MMIAIFSVPACVFGIKTIESRSVQCFLAAFIFCVVGALIFDVVRFFNNENVRERRLLKRRFKKLTPFAKKIFGNILQKDVTVFTFVQTIQEDGGTDKSTGYYYVQNSSTMFAKAEPNDIQKKEQIENALQSLDDADLIFPEYSSKDSSFKKIHYKIDRDFIVENRSLVKKYIVETAPIFRPRYRK